MSALSPSAAGWDVRRRATSTDISMLVEPSPSWERRIKNEKFKGAVVKVRGLLGLVALVAVVQGCDARETQPTREEETAYAETPPATGEPVTFFVYTHCGVESARIGGLWWHATEPLYGEGGEGTSPPGGWGDPYQEGRLTVEAPKRATFEAEGTRVVFEPSTTNKPVRICR